MVSVCGDTPTVDVSYGEPDLKTDLYSAEDERSRSVTPRQESDEVREGLPPLFKQFVSRHAAFSVAFCVAFFVVFRVAVCVACCVVFCVGLFFVFRFLNIVYCVPFSVLCR